MGNEAVPRRIAALYHVVVVISHDGTAPRLYHAVEETVEKLPFDRPLALEGGCEYRKYTAVTDGHKILLLFIR